MKGKLFYEIETAMVYTACRQNNIGGLRTLLGNGYNPNFKNNDYMYTPLHMACRNGNLEMVQLLIDNGACPLWTNVYNQQPIWLAAYWCHIEVFEYLLDKSSEPYDKLIDAINDGLTGEHKKVGNIQCIDLNYKENVSLMLTKLGVKPKSDKIKIFI